MPAKTGKIPVLIGSGLDRCGLTFREVYFRTRIAREMGLHWHCHGLAAPPLPTRLCLAEGLGKSALGGPHGFLERGLQVAERYGVAGALARLVVRWPAPSSNWLAEDLVDNYPDAMSNVGEIITAVTQLSPAEQWDIYQWLNESPAITRRRLDALREDVALGLAQADRGDVAPLDIEAVKAEMRRHLAPTTEG